MPFKLTLIFLIITLNTFGQKINISPADSSYFTRLDYSQPYSVVGESGRQLKDSLKNGYYCVFYTSKKNELALEGLVENNKKEGTWTTYNKNGGIRNVLNYKDGKLNGPFFRYDLSGVLTREGNYLDNKLDGLLKTYYSFQNDMGRLGRSDGSYGSFNYSKGNLDGPADFWKEDFTVHVTCNYKRNAKDGQVIYKNQFDELLKIETYDNGTLVSTEKFENRSYETTYTHYLSIPHNADLTPGQIEQNLQKIDSCTNLHNLVLSNSSPNKNMDSLVQLHLSSLKNLSNITSIRLRGGGFHSIPLALFQCVNLKKLTIESTSIADLPAEILNFKFLHSLEIDQRNFNDIDALIKTIAQLKNLKELELHGFTKGVPKNIHLLSQIEALYFIYHSDANSDEFPIHPDLFRMKNLKVIELPPDIYYEPKYKKLFEKKMPNCVLAANETCFAPSVHISLANHTSKPINEMKVGDIIIAYDFLKKEVDTAIVNAVHIHSNKDQQLIEITYQGNVEITINCTENHPFLTIDNQWLNALELKVGDTIYMLDQMQIKEVVIKSVRPYKNTDQVFNISTSKENYFANGILVHNK